MGGTRGWESRSLTPAPCSPTPCPLPLRPPRCASPCLHLHITTASVSPLPPHSPRHPLSILAYPTPLLLPLLYSGRLQTHSSLWHGSHDCSSLNPVWLQRHGDLGPIKSCQWDRKLLKWRVNGREAEAAGVEGKRRGSRGCGGKRQGIGNSCSSGPNNSCCLPATHT